MEAQAVLDKCGRCCLWGPRRDGARFCCVAQEGGRGEAKLEAGGLLKVGGCGRAEDGRGILVATCCTSGLWKVVCLWAELYTTSFSVVVVVCEAARRDRRFCARQ